MTETDLAAVVSAIAPVVRECITKAVADLTPRLAAVEARINVLGDVRDRVVTIETKAAIPPVAPSAPPDLTPVIERLAVAEARVLALADVRERVTAVEAKAAMPPSLPPVPVMPDLAPLLERLAAAEARVSVLGDLRDRVVAVETKAAAPPPAAPPDPAVGELRDRVGSLEHMRASVADMPGQMTALKDSITHELSTLRERVAVLETRAPVPGPAGKDGQNGLNGKDGADGLGFDDLAAEFDGDRTINLQFTRGTQTKSFPIVLPYLRYQGVYQEGKGYTSGDVVTWAGSTWTANEATNTKPGDGAKSWTLCVKRGRDGKDGAPGADGKPGRDLTKEVPAWQRS